MGALGGDGLQLAQRGEPGEGLALELADALARQVELVPDRLERPGLAFEAEAQLEDPPLTLRKRVERPPHTLAPERFLGLLERVGSLAVGEQIAELALVVRADGLVQRDRGLRGAERLVDVLERKAGRLRELFLGRLAAELDLEPARRAAELLLALDDVDGNTDRARVVRDGALHRLGDPPGRVRGDLVAAPPVELLDRAVEAERALLDQVEEGDAEAAVALGDRDHESEVRLDHPALGEQVAALDRLREHDLLGRGQELVPPDVGEEELEAVGRADHRLRLRVGRLGRRRLLGGGLGRLFGGLAHLEAVGLELTRQQLDLVVGEVVLERERLELGRQDEAALLRSFEQHARGLGLQQFLKLGLSQFLLVGVRRRTASNLSHCRTIVLDWPGGFGPPVARRSKRGRCTSYSATAASLVCARAGKSNSTLPSPFKTRRARKGLPARDRNPEMTSFVFPSSSSWRASSGVSVRPATRFQITKPQPGSSRLFQLVHP